VLLISGFDAIEVHRNFFMGWVSSTPLQTDY